MTDLSCLEPSGRDVLLRVLVQPRSGRDQLVGLYGDRLKVRLSAPPVEGAANQRCCQFLARCLGLAKHRVNLHSGLRSRRKTLRLDNVSTGQVSRCLERLLAD